jgi:hypothetical protein
MLTITLYDQAKSKTTGNRVDISEKDFGTMLARLCEETRSVKDGPCFLPGPVGRGRGGRTPRYTCLVPVDVDDATQQQVIDAVRNAKELGFRFWVYSTYSSSAESPRVRFVWPVGEELTRGQHVMVWEHLNAVIGGIGDPACKHAARVHYLPARRAGGPPVFFHSEEAPSLSLADLPEDVPAAPPPRLKVTDAEVMDQLSEVLGVTSRLRAPNPYAPFLRRLGQSEPLAAPGERHQTVLLATWWLATRFKNLAPETIEALFGPPLDASEQTAGMETVQDAIVAYEGALARQEEHAADVTGQGNLSLEELTSLAQGQGYEGKEPEAWLSRRWILVKDRSYYLLDHERGRYLGPLTRDEMEAEMVHVLGRAPVGMVRERANGGFRLATLKELTNQHSQSVSKVIYDAQTTADFFNASDGTLYRAPYEQLHTPRFHDHVDTWLRILGDDPLVDWVACAPHLDRRLCALYLDGVPGAGKTLLATGLSHIWSEGGAVEMVNVLARFNDDLLRCPVVLADESVPAQYGKDTTAELRSLIAHDEHTVEVKYKPQMTLQSFLRVVLTANNRELLTSSKGLSREDIEALAERFLYIKATDESRDFLLSLTQEQREAMADHEIAEHALYLAEHHDVVPAGRFWVDGDMSEMVQMLVVSNHWTSLVCQLLVEYLNKKQVAPKLKEGIIGRHGFLLVDIEAVKFGWRLLLGETKEYPNLKKISEALHNISTDVDELDGRRFFVIDSSYLFAWSEETGVSSPAKIKAAIESLNP